MNSWKFYIFFTVWSLIHIQLHGQSGDVISPMPHQAEDTHDAHHAYFNPFEILSLNLNDDPHILEEYLQVYLKTQASPINSPVFKPEDFTPDEQDVDPKRSDDHLKASILELIQKTSIKELKHWIARIDAKIQDIESEIQDQSALAIWRNLLSRNLVIKQAHLAQKRRLHALQLEWNLNDDPLLNIQLWIECIFSQTSHKKLSHLLSKLKLNNQLRDWIKAELSKKNRPNPNQRNNKPKQKNEKLPLIKQLRKCKKDRKSPMSQIWTQEQIEDQQDEENRLKAALEQIDQAKIKKYRELLKQRRADPHRSLGKKRLAFKTNKRKKKTLHPYPAIRKKSN